MANSKLPSLLGVRLRSFSLRMCTVMYRLVATTTTRNVLLDKLIDLDGETRIVVDAGEDAVPVRG